MADIIRSAEVFIMTRKKYDRAFKLESVKMVVSQQRPAAAVARELGTQKNTLYKWINFASEGHGEAFPGSGNLSAEDAEMSRLKRKIAELEEENVILKNATVYFAKHQK
jgi:transposase